MNIADSTVLITGANRGLGAVFLEKALARGASKVYAASRTPGTWEDPRVVPLRIDVTDEQTILDAAQIADDVTEMSTEFVGLVPMIEADFAVNAVYDQLEAGRYEIIVDDTGLDMKQLLALPPEEIPAAFGGLQG